MSETTYVPRAGSKAEAAVAALGQRKWLCAADLALEIDCDRNSVDQNIAVAIREGLIRRVARDGKAGFSLGSTGDPPARQDEDDEAAPKRTKTRKAKPAAKKKAEPQRQAEPKPAKVKRPDGEALYPTKYTVGILECGTFVVIDSMGHAMTITPLTARRIADLVARTA